MQVLCLGGTGTVGSQVVQRLLERGIAVRCTTRSEDRVGRGPDGASFVLADLEDPETLGPAFQGADRVHLLTPLHPEEARLGRAAIDAAREAGVERVVLHSVHHAHAAPRVPHFASKMEMLEALDASGLSWISVEPNNYFQNDHWLKVPILEQGIYPAPLGPVGLSRVDVRDIADVTVNALLDDVWDRIRCPVVGPEVLTGERVAETWSRHLGREIAYVGDDLDAWEAAARDTMPDWMVDDLRLMFEHFLEHGLVASEEDIATMSHLLGHAPRTFGEFVAETVASWDAD